MLSLLPLFLQYKRNLLYLLRERGILVNKGLDDKVFRQKTFLQLEANFEASTKNGNMKMRVDDVGLTAKSWKYENEGG